MLDVAPPFQSQDVAQVFAGYPDADRAKLIELRGAIFDEAARLPEVGAVVECLKWGQPAYLTPETKSGSTIRLGTVKAGGIGLFTHCQTSLISDFQSTVGQGLRFDGNRAVLFSSADELPKAQLRSLIRSALTYHLNK